jgi:plastocyanin domain-containing protein
VARKLHERPAMKKQLLALLAGVSLLSSAASASPARPKKAPRQVEVTVTSDGFQPAEIKTRAGEPLRLVITRKTDRTCAKEVVIKDLGVHEPLPLNQAVTVDITPRKDGQLRYGCAMDMITGVILVE